MENDWDDLDFGLQDLKWPTVPDEPAPQQPTPGDPVAERREPVPDLLEQEIAAARVNGQYVPVGVVQQHALVTPAPPPADVPPPQRIDAPVEAERPMQVFLRPIETRLFIALQTVPDYERAARMRLPLLPQIGETCELEDLPSPDVLIASREKFQKIIALMEEKNPPRIWVESLLIAEQKTSTDRRKWRRAIVEECTRRIQLFDDFDAAVAERILVMSATSEFAQIVGVAFACGDGPAHALVSGQTTKVGVQVTERAMLSLFWRSLQAVRTVVCWGDPSHLLATRSCLVGVDLQMLRKMHVENLAECVRGDESLGPHSLADVCQAYGVDSAVDHMPAQMVVADAWARGDVDGVRESACARLESLRKLWRKWEGFHVAVK